MFMKIIFLWFKYFTLCDISILMNKTAVNNCDTQLCVCMYVSVNKCINSRRMLFQFIRSILKTNCKVLN